MFYFKIAFKHLIVYAFVNLYYAIKMLMMIDIIIFN